MRKQMTEQEPLRQLIRERLQIIKAEEGSLTCARASRLAEELGVAPRLVGETATAMGLKITDCQLGCFGSKGRI